jgi:hypothetical protein
MHVLVEGYYSLVSDKNGTEDMKTTINNANCQHHQQQQQHMHLFPLVEYTSQVFYGVPYLEHAGVE